MYSATFDEDWPHYFGRLENETKERVAKKIKKILAYPKKRHLKQGTSFFVDEIGQYRILYRVFDSQQEVRFYFVGNHKEYEKWYKEAFRQ
jgi:mRNA-degrading endonuclease RelE of RelBE toxin-antitoxin system